MVLQVGLQFGQPYLHRFTAGICVGLDIVGKGSRKCGGLADTEFHERVLCARSPHGWSTSAKITQAGARRTPSRRARLKMIDMDSPTGASTHTTITGAA